MASKEVKQHTTPSSDTKRGPIGAGVKISRVSLFQTLVDMGQLWEVEQEVLVEGNLQGHASLRIDMRELPTAFWDLAPWRATPNLHASHSLQVDSRFSDDADGGGTNEVPGACDKELTNQVEGQALMNKTIAIVCRFLIEDVICWYECVGKIMADWGNT